jgi:hypothetical protein
MGSEVAEIDRLLGTLQALLDAEASDVSPRALRKAIGREGIERLRREYFPRWRPGREVDANPRLRAFRRIVVKNEFERRVVQAVAPRDLAVRVTLEDEIGHRDLALSRR